MKFMFKKERKKKGKKGKRKGGKEGVGFGGREATEQTQAPKICPRGFPHSMTLRDWLYKL